MCSSSNAEGELNQLYCIRLRTSFRWKTPVFRNLNESVVLKQMTLQGSDYIINVLNVVYDVDDVDVLL